MLAGTFNLNPPIENAWEIIEHIYLQPYLRHKNFCSSKPQIQLEILYILYLAFYKF